MKTSFPLWLLLFFIIFQYSCMRQIGKNLATGVNEEADSISHNLVDGAVSSLTSPDNQEKVKDMAKALVNEIFSEAEVQLKKIPLDSLGGQLVEGAEQALFKPEVKQQLTDLVQSLLTTAGQRGTAEVEQLLSTLLEKFRSREMDQTIAHLRRDLLGPQTGQALRQLLQTTLDSINTKHLVGDLRDELLSEATNKAFLAIIDSAMTSIAYHINHDINPAIKRDLSFVQKYARGLLITAGLITFGIIAFSWYQRRKYLKMVTLMATEIHQIPDQKVYDGVTRKIQEKAINHSLEPELRQLLESNGLLGKTAWEANQEKQA